MSHSFSFEHYNGIGRQVDDAQRKLRDTHGSTVAIVCTGGAVVKGGWIDMHGGTSAPQVEVHDEDDGEIICTRITLDNVAGITVTTPAPFSVDQQWLDQRVPPSRREMTILSVLVEVWGRMDGPATVEDLRQALRDIEAGTAAPTRTAESGGSGRMVLDAAYDSEKPKIRQLLNVLARRNAPGHIMDHVHTMELADLIDMLVTEEMPTGDRKEAIRKEMKQIDADPSSRLSELDAEIRDALMARARTAIAIRELRMAYHPFIPRMQLRDRAQGL